RGVNKLLGGGKVMGTLGLVALPFTGAGAGASRYDLGALAAPDATWPGRLLTALVPIMFAYGGWQNCASVAGEIKDPARNLARANVLGVLLVVALYLGLNLADLRVLTPGQVAASKVLARDA